MPTADDLLNEACASLSDEEALRDDWRAVSFALAHRCAKAEADLARLVEAARVVAKDPYPGSVKFDGALELQRLDDLCRLRDTLRSIEEKRDAE